MPFSPSRRRSLNNAGVINPVGVADQRIGQTAQMDESVPVGIVARQSRDLKTQNETHVSERDLGGQAAKPDRATAPDPERPRSSSMTRTLSAVHPRSVALFIKAYCRSVDFAVVLNLSGAALRANDDETKTCREFTLEGRGHSIQWLCPF